MRLLWCKVFIPILQLSLIVCSGMAFAADIVLTPAGLDMGFRLANQNFTTQEVTIANNGSVELVVSSVTISGGGAGAFSAAAGTCTNLTPAIAPGTNCTVNITFSPASGQYYLASLDIASNSAVTPIVNVALNGGGAYPLAVFIASGPGTGTLRLSAPDPVDAGLSCAPDAAYCGAYPAGTSITLTPQPSAVSAFNGWSGCPMTMGDSCLISINGAVNATASFSLASLQSLINNAFSGEVIKLPIATYTETVMMNRPGLLLTLSGGWTDHAFASQAGFTSVTGSLTIADGTLILENIQII